jgi:hypothetical protein
VDGAVTSHPQLSTQVEVASADKDPNDSMGVLSCLSATTPVHGTMVRSSTGPAHGAVPRSSAIGSDSSVRSAILISNNNEFITATVHGTVPISSAIGSDSSDRNTILFSNNNELITSSSISNAILQWMSDNQCISDIRSMGEIISGMSDLAISISADKVESWVNEAVEILHEKKYRK